MSALYHVSYSNPKVSGHTLLLLKRGLFSFSQVAGIVEHLKKEYTDDEKVIIDGITELHRTSRRYPSMGRY